MSEFNQEKFPKSFIVSILALTIGLILIGYLYYTTQKNIYLNDKKQDLSSLNVLKVNEISAWLNERIGDARTIYSNEMTIEKFNYFFKSPNQEQLKKSINNWLENRKNNYGYESILLLDSKFKLRFSTEVVQNGSLVIDTTLLHYAGKTQKIEVSRLYQYKNYVFIDIIIPLKLGESSQIPAGYVILKINMQKFLYPLIFFKPRNEPSLETNLIELQNDTVIYLNRFHKWDDYILFNKVALDNIERVAVKAVKIDSGIVFGKDYKNVEVIAACNKIPGTKLILMTKIDYEEIYTDLGQKLRNILIAGIIIIFFSSLTLIIIWKNKVSGFYKREYEFELENKKLRARFENLNKYANEIIILIDENGHIVDVNNKAVEVYGHTRSEFLKLNIKDIRAVSLGITYPALEESLDNNKIYTIEHKTKNGKIFPVEISISKIIIEGETYYSEYIRDISDRKLSEEKIQYINQLYSILSHVNQAILYNPGREDLLQKVCDVFIEVGKYKFVWIGYVDYEKKIIKPVYSRGDSADYLKGLVIKTDDSVHGRGPTGSAARTGSVIVSNLISNDPKMEAFKIRADKYGFRSSAAVPVFFEGRVEAVISVYSENIHSFNEADIELLKEIGGDISFALENIEVEAKKELYRKNLQESEMRFKNLFNNVPVGIYQASYDGKILLANKAYLNILGYNSIEELQNIHLNDLYVDKSVRNKFVERLKNGEKIIGEEIQFYRKDQTVIWAKVDLILLNNNDNKNTNVFEGTIVDITHKKKYEEGIINEKVFSESLLNSLPELFLLIDEQLNIVRFNKNLFDLFEYEVDEIMNLKPIDFVVTGEKGFAKERLQKAFAEGSDFSELNCISKSGKIYPLYLTSSCITLYKKKYLLILGTDITERKKMINDLVTLKEKAEEANHLKTIFLANMSHEIRTPLIGIMGYAEILESEISDNSLKEMASTIILSGKRLKETLNAILDLSRIEANRLEINISRVSLSEIIKKVVKLFYPVAMKKGLELIITQLDKEYLALLDEIYYEQIINNLISNAIKFTQKGQIKIELLYENIEDSIFIKTSVSDTGIGIKPELLELIFEPFRQGSEGMGRTFEGTGLGLTICKKLTEIMNGKIVVKSEVGKGSVFEIYFPAA